METLSKKLKEGPDVSSQMENGTPTKVKGMRKCISLHRGKKQLFPKSRFKTVVQPETLLSTCISKGYTLSNTLKNTELTMKNVWTWLEQRNSRAAAISEDACPVNLLSSTDHSELS